MKKYVKPQFRIIEFTPNESIAACLTGNKELTFTCLDCGASITGKFIGSNTNDNRIEGIDSKTHESIVYWPDVRKDSSSEEKVLCAQFSGSSRGCHTSDYQENGHADGSNNDGCLIYPSGWGEGGITSEQHHHIGETITINLS